MVEKDYFDPTIGAKVASTLREELAKGRYAKAPDLESLANLLTSDMYAVAKDRHLSLFVAKGLPSRPSLAPTVAQESRRERGQHENFGLQKAEVLPGNVGYLRLTGFYQPQEAREAIAASMAFLSNSDALIVDLRDHGGGSSQTVALFTSYLLSSPEMPLFEIAHRSQAAPDQYLTESGNLAHRNGTRPTFLLTSPRTSSGGEAVAFLLQERHRAEVIGEGTWGGANQVPPPRAVTQSFEALIPNGHTTSALTGKNWEGVGVVPDIPVRADNALRVAHARAIQALLRSAPQGSWHEQLKQELELLERQVGTEPTRH
jgi:C-terminal processing protease CtpA/Prc